MGKSRAVVNEVGWLWIASGWALAGCGIGALVVRMSRVVPETVRKDGLTMGRSGQYHSPWAEMDQPRSRLGWTWAALLFAGLCLALFAVGICVYLASVKQPSWASLWSLFAGEEAAVRGAKRKAKVKEGRGPMRAPLRAGSAGQLRAGSAASTQSASSAGLRAGSASSTQSAGSLEERPQSCVRAAVLEGGCAWFQIRERRTMRLEALSRSLDRASPLGVLCAAVLADVTHSEGDARGTDCGDGETRGVRDPTPEYSLEAVQALLTHAEAARVGALWREVLAGVRADLAPLDAALPRMDSFIRHKLLLGLVTIAQVDALPMEAARAVRLYLLVRYQRDELQQLCEPCRTLYGPAGPCARAGARLDAAMRTRVERDVNDATAKVRTRAPRVAKGLLKSYFDMRAHAKLLQFEAGGDEAGSAKSDARSDEAQSYGALDRAIGSLDRAVAAYMWNGETKLSPAYLATLRLSTETQALLEASLLAYHDAALTQQGRKLLPKLVKTALQAVNLLPQRAKPLSPKTHALCTQAHAFLLPTLQKLQKRQDLLGHQYLHTRFGRPETMW